MSVMSKHLQEYMGDSEAQKKQWMQHFGVNAAGDIVNKKRHDSAVAGMVGAVDNEGNLIDVEKFKEACEAIKSGAEAKANHQMQVARRSVSATSMKIPRKKS